MFGKKGGSPYGQALKNKKIKAIDIGAMSNKSDDASPDPKMESVKDDTDELAPTVPMKNAGAVKKKFGNLLKD